MEAVCTFCDRRESSVSEKLSTTNLPTVFPIAVQHPRLLAVRHVRLTAQLLSCPSSLSLYLSHPIILLYRVTLLRMQKYHGPRGKKTLVGNLASMTGQGP